MTTLFHCPELVDDRDAAEVEMLSARLADAAELEAAGASCAELDAHRVASEQAAEQVAQLHAEMVAAANARELAEELQAAAEAELRAGGQRVATAEAKAASLSNRLDSAERDAKQAGARARDADQAAAAARDLSNVALLEQRAQAAITEAAQRAAEAAELQQRVSERDQTIRELEMVSSKQLGLAAASGYGRLADAPELYDVEGGAAGGAASPPAAAAFSTAAARLDWAGLLRARVTLGPTTQVPLPVILAVLLLYSVGLHGVVWRCLVG